MLCFVEFVFSKDAMEDAVAVFQMCDAFKEVENGCNEDQMSGEKKAIVRWQRRKTIMNEEKQMQQHQ
jgi:hypothetical protein